MIYLKKSLLAWGSSTFNDALKQEVEELRAEELPLQKGLSLSSYVSNEPFNIMVINAVEDDETIRVKAGVFYTGIIAGCSCSDDPGPTDVQPEYCDVQLEINKSNAGATITLLT
jgi:hypothetical protein